VGDARLEDDFFLLPDRPGRPLSLVVHGAVNGERVVGEGVVVVAADHPTLVDRQLKDLVGGLLLAAHQGENAQRLPLLLLRGLRPPAGRRRPGPLGGLLARGGPPARRDLNPCPLDRPRTRRSRITRGLRGTASTGNRPPIPQEPGRGGRPPGPPARPPDPCRT